MTGGDYLVDGYVSFDSSVGVTGGAHDDNATAASLSGKSLIASQDVSKTRVCILAECIISRLYR